MEGADAPGAASVLFPRASGLRGTVSVPTGDPRAARQRRGGGRSSASRAGCGWPRGVGPGGARLARSLQALQCGLASALWGGPVTPLLSQ